MSWAKSCGGQSIGLSCSSSCKAHPNGWENAELPCSAGKNPRRLPDRFFFWETKDVLRSGIPLDDAALWIENEHGVISRAIDEQMKMLRTCAQRFGGSKRVFRELMIPCLHSLNHFFRGSTP